MNSIAMSCFTKLDLIGLNYELTINGSATYKTAFGAFLSVVLTILSILTIVFFSMDFVLRTNPKIISSTYRTGDLNIYGIDNSNFFISFTTVNYTEVSIDKEKQYMFPKITYNYMNNTIGGENLVVNMEPTPCSSLKVLPDLMANKHYQNSTCFDFNKLAKQLNKEKVPFFGSFESSSNSYFSLELSNCQFDHVKGKYHSCLSQEEVAKRSVDLNFFLLRYPKVQTNLENFNEPLSLQFEEKYFVTNNKMQMNDIYRFTNVNLMDDIGWIFPNERTFTGISFVRDSTTFGINDKDNYANQEKVTFYYAEFIFSLDEVHAKRVYVKLQEIAANVGGIIKVIMMIANFLNNKISIVSLNNFLIDELQRVKKKSITSQNPNTSSVALKETVIESSKVSFLDIAKFIFSKTNSAVTEYYNNLKLVKKSTEVKTLIRLNLENVPLLSNTTHVSRLRVRPNSVDAR